MQDVDDPWTLVVDGVRRRADTWRLWAAASRVRDGGTAPDDASRFFPVWSSQVWLVGLGRAYERTTGTHEGLDEAIEACGHGHGFSPDPQDEQGDLRDPAGFARPCPRLAELFPATGR